MDDELQNLCNIVVEYTNNVLEQYDWDGKFKAYLEGLD